MKKKLFITCLLLLLVRVVFGQDSTTILAKQSVLLEFAGTGQGISLSYDRVLSQKKSWKFGARAGVGAISFTQVRPTILGEVYALRGRKNKYLEMGLGLSYLFPVTSQYSIDTTRVTFRGADQLWLVSRIGYRKQNTKRGNVFRVALTPTFIFQSGRASFRLYPGISVGQSF